MPHSTILSQVLSDRLWELTQGRQTRFIQAQQSARERAQQIAAIRAAYTFTLYDIRTFYAGGELVQSSMLVENPDDASDRYVVTCSTETGEEVWTTETPPLRRHLGPLFIAAVQSRVADRRSNEQSRRASA